MRKQEATNIRGLCVLCGKNPQKKKSNGLYRAICSPCDKRLYDVHRNRRIAASQRPYRKHVQEICERCGFVAIDLCQMDVHHKDHNHENNSPDNLETLCANCHRLEHR